MLNLYIYIYTVGFFVSFIINMRIGNTKCTSKEINIRHYIYLIAKVFDENSETIQGGGGVLNAN